MTEFLKKIRSAGEIISAAAELLRKRWDVMLACVLPLFLPLLVARWLTTGQLSLLLNYAVGLVTPVAGAVAAVVVDEEPNRGATIGRVFDRLRGRWPAIITVSFIQGIITAIGFFLLVIPGLIWTAWTFAAPAVIVLEREHDIFSSFRRSKELANDQFGHIWGTLILGWLIVGVTCAAGVAAITLPARLLGIDGRGLSFLYGIGYAAIQTFVGLTGAVLYFDLRARQAMERWPVRPLEVGDPSRDKVSS